MKKVLTLIAVTALFAGSISAANIDLSALSADTAWFAHFDMEQFEGSKLHNLANERGLEKKCERAEKFLGFNPVADIKSMTVYGTSANPKNGVVIIKGNLNSETLIGLAKEQADYAASQYNELTLHTWQGNDGKSKAGVFFNENTLLMARGKGILIKAVDVLSGQSESLAGSDYIVSGDAIMQMFITNASYLADKDPRLGFLKNVNQTLFAVGQKGEEMFAEFIMNANSEEDAQLLKQMAMGMMAMAQMYAEDISPGASAIVKNININVDGQSVVTSLVIDADELDKIIAANSDILLDLCSQLPAGCNF